MTGFKTTATAAGAPVKVGDRITAQDFFGLDGGVSGPVVAIDEGNMVIVTEADSLDGSRVGMKVWVPINMGVFDWDGRVTVETA